MIPRILHYVWVGSAVPDKQKAFIATWRASNPDYRLMRWDETNINFNLPNMQEAYDKRQWAKVADIARLAAVLDHGGIYLDTDFRVVKPLDPLLEHACFYGFQHEFHLTDWVANGAFGAVPGHWFIQKALDEILGMRSSRFERPTAFGPKLITRLLREEGLKDDMYSPDGAYVRDVFLCPTHVFFPFKFGEHYTDACITPNTLAAHFWEQSWEKDIPMLLRMARSLRNRLKHGFA